MDAIADSAEFEWIKRSRRPMPEQVNASSGVELGCVVPLGFERYAKILHRLDAHYENIDQPLTAEEMVILQMPDCRDVRDLVTEKRASSSSSRILWKDAARALGAPFAPEINHGWFANRLEPYPDCWPRYIWGPAEGNLERDECHELVRVLRSVTGDERCFFRLAEMPFIASDQNLLFAGRLEEVEEFFVDGSFQYTPEYWWPHHRRWCVCSDYDLGFTIVGGSSALIEALLGCELLECIEVPPNIRVDSLVPIPSFNS